MSHALRVFNHDMDIMQEIFRQISQYAEGEIIITDEKFNILFHNSKNIEFTDKYNLFDIIDSFLNENIRINIENFKNSNKEHLFFKLIFNGNGMLKNTPINLHICKINKRNKIKGYSIIIQDISQEVKNKIQKETFIDIISHDLKNPMRANIQILELILKNKFGELKTDLKIVLEELLSSCQFMNYMADNLLIKYKNEFDLYELKMQKYSIIKLIKNRCNNLMNFLERKNQSIELIIKGEIPFVNIDIDEMSKVVNNLIINASEQSIKNSKIIIQIEIISNCLNVSFTDYGYPKKPEILKNIFEEYISCSNKFRKIGFSLELYNCKKIIEAHNGKIFAGNESETGTTITFAIPISYN